MMLIENKFEIGQTVYLKTEKDQSARMVVRLLLTPNGILYFLVCGTVESAHYEIEISDKVNVVLATTN